MGAGRANDVPNIATGNIWAGNADGVATATSVAYIDIANERVGIGTASPSQKAVISGPNTTPTLNSAAVSSASLLVSNSDTGYGTYFAALGSGVGLIQQRRQTSEIYYGLALNPYGGNVGIGTTAPAKKLHVLNSTNEAQIRLGQSGSGSYDMGVYSGDTFSIGRDADTREFTLSGGNVGIGVTSPAEKLEVLGNIRLNTVGNQLEFSNANVALQRGASNVLELGGYGGIAFKASAAAIDSQTERMRITDAGNVGIGTSSPDTELHVESGDAILTLEGSNSSYVNAAVQLVSNHASNLRGMGTFAYTAHTDVEWFWGNPYSTNDAFVINRNTGYTVPSSQNSPPGIGASAGTLFKIDSSGNVGIGTTSPTYNLDVQGPSNGIIRAYGPSIGRLSLQNSTSHYSTSVQGSKWYFFDEASGASRMVIDSSGNVGIGTTSPTSKLDVNGTVTASGPIDSSDGTNTAITSETARFNKYGLLANRGSMYITNYAAGGSILFGIGGVHSAYNKMALAGTGHLGIGTTTPSARLDSRVDDGNTHSLRLGRTDTSSFWDFIHAGDDLRIYNAGGSGKDILLGVNSAGVDQGNKVGIGTASPSAKLDVAGLANINDGSNNVMISSGNTALTTGVDNTAVGDNALQSVTSGSYNSAFGAGALTSNSTGVSNSAFGHGALRLNTGANNTAFGTASLRNKTSGDNNSAFGVNALYTNATGSNNIAIGRNAGYYTTGSNNALIGYYAGYGGATSTFSNTVALGYQALTALTIGENNVAVGFQAGLSNTEGDDNVFVGGFAGQANTTGDNNAFVGRNAGYANISGSVNSFLGVSAGRYNTTGYSNTFLGGLAGNQNTIGYSNSFVGVNAGYSNTSGDNNSFFGRDSGYSNSTGNGNIFLGYKAGYYETLSNKLYIANSDTTTPLIYGDFSLGEITINGDLNVSGGNLRADAVEINGRALTTPATGEYGAGSRLVTQFASGTVTAGKVYVANAGAWAEGDANAGSTSIGMIAVATDAASATEMLIEGVIKLSSNTGFSGASAGDVLYLSTTAGELTTTAPSTAGEYVRVCGYVVNASTNEVFFSPSRDWTAL